METENLRLTGTSLSGGPAWLSRGSFVAEKVDSGFGVRYTLDAVPLNWVVIPGEIVLSFGSRQDTDDPIMAAGDSVFFPVFNAVYVKPLWRVRFTSKGWSEN